MFSKPISLSSLLVKVKNILPSSVIKDTNSKNFIFQGFNRHRFAGWLQKFPKSIYSHAVSMKANPGRRNSRMYSPDLIYVSTRYWAGTLKKSDSGIINDKNYQVIFSTVGW